MTAASALQETSFGLELGRELGREVVSAGFVLGDHEAIVRELSALDAPGLPGRAVPKRRAEFLAGRLAAQRALRALGVDALPGRNEDGSPNWPQAVVGSITHGAGRALCAVSRSGDLRSLGIDAERLMAASVKEELKRRICSDAERALLLASVAAPEEHLVTLAFSAKESLYKCLYPFVGKYMDFTAARVVEASATVDGSSLRGVLTLELSVDWSPEFRRGQRMAAPCLASNEHVETAVLLPL